MAVLISQLRQYFTIAEYKKGLGLRLTYVVLQLADLMMTVLAANAGYEEMNPLMRGLLSSPMQLVTFKFIIPMAIAWLVPSKLLIPALVLLAAIIGLNIKELVMVLV